jgi:hypothetical protein
LGRYELVVVALPTIPFILLYLAYLRILQGKRRTVQQLFSQSEVFESYVRAFGLKDTKQPTPGSVVDALFNLYYHWGSYAFAIFPNVLIAITVTACVLVRAGLPLLPGGLEELAQKTPPTVAFGFAGAYIGTFYDLIVFLAAFAGRLPGRAASSSWRQCRYKKRCCVWNRGLTAADDLPVFQGSRHRVFWCCCRAGSRRRT